MFQKYLFFIGNLKVRLFLDFKEIIRKKDFEIVIEREMTIKELIKLLVDSFSEIKNTN